MLLQTVGLHRKFPLLDNQILTQLLFPEDECPFLEIEEFESKAKTSTLTLDLTCRDGTAGLKAGVQLRFLSFKI